MLIYKILALSKKDVVGIYYLSLTFFYLGIGLVAFGLFVLLNTFKFKRLSNLNANVQPLLFSDFNFNWDLYNEVVRRIWLPFWENLFNNDREY